MNHSIEPKTNPALSNHSMRRLVPELDQLLRDLHVIHVQVDYSGGECRGDLDAPLITYADGSPELVANGPFNAILKATFRALLLVRHPVWNAGSGSCGTFGWDLQTDALTHSHCPVDEASESMIHYGCEGL